MEKLHLPIENVYLDTIDFNNEFFDSMKKENSYFEDSMKIRSKMKDRALIIRYQGQIVLFCSYKVSYKSLPTSAPSTAKKILIDNFKTRLPNSMTSLILVLVRLSIWYKADSIIWYLSTKDKNYDKIQQSLNVHAFTYVGKLSFGGKVIMKFKL